MYKLAIIFLLATGYLSHSQSTNNLIPFRAGELWGYSNESGEILIEPQFIRVSQFSNNHGYVYKKNTSGAINSKGDYLIPLDSHDIRIISKNLYVLAHRHRTDHNFVLVDSNLNNVHNNIYSTFFIKHGFIEITDTNNLVGICDSTGYIIFPCLYDRIEVLNNGQFLVSKNNKYALSTTTGNILTEFNYIIIDDFYHGWSKARINNDFLFINQQGKHLNSEVFDYCHPFSEGYAVVKKNEKYGLIDSNGQLNIPYIYDDLHDLHGGVSSFQKNDQWGLINSSGKILTSIKYNTIKRQYQGVMVAQKENKWGVLSLNGIELSDFIYDNIEFDENDDEQVRFNGKRPDKYDFGYLTVIKDKLYGIVNKQGEEIIKPIYDNIYPYTNGVAIVRKDNKLALVDTNGILITKFEFDKLDPYLAGGDCLRDNGVLLYSQDDYRGIISNTGEKITESVYDYIVPVDNEFFIIVKKGKAGIINIKTGEEVIKCKYDRIQKQGIGFDRYTFLNGLAMVIKEGKLGFIGLDGKEYFKD